jgi:hypothetical protein
MTRAHQLGRLVPVSLRPVLRAPVVRYRHRGLGEADVLFVSYPKSGSTWLRLVLAHAITGREADFDSVRTDVPPIGGHRGAPGVLPGGGRLVRTHEPISAVPGHHRFVYLVRDGRQVATSYFHHVDREAGGSLDPGAFADQLLDGKVDGYGTWDDHVLEAAAQPAGLLALVRYEQLRADPVGEVGKVLDALGVTVPPGQVEAAVAANTKDRMQAKQDSSAFLAGRPNEGAKVVRDDSAARWPAPFTPADATRIEQAWRAGLAAFDYTA